jgi:hypothetical protein
MAVDCAACESKLSLCCVSSPSLPLDGGAAPRAIRLDSLLRFRLEAARLFRNR